MCYRLRLGQFHSLLVASKQILKEMRTFASQFLLWNLLLRHNIRKNIPRDLSRSSVIKADYFAQWKFSIRQIRPWTIYASVFRPETVMKDWKSWNRPIQRSTHVIHSKPRWQWFSSQIAISQYLQGLQCLYFSITFFSLLKINSEYPSRINNCLDYYCSANGNWLVQERR